MQKIILLRWLIHFVTGFERVNRTVLRLISMKHPVTVCCLSTDCKTTLQKRQTVQQTSHPVRDLIIPRKLHTPS